MSTTTGLSDANADDEERRVEALAEFDERLRKYGPDAALGQPAGPESSDVEIGEGLRDCLTLLETVWPRAKPTAAELAELWPDTPRQIGRFHVQRLLGGGGFSLVYLVHDPALNRSAALKLPRPHMVYQKALRKRFLLEAQAIGALDHPNIVPVFETGEIGPAVYLAMAYCEGPNLGDWLANRDRPVDPRLAARLVADLAGAISYSHAQGILHRDLKPANVLLFPKHGVASAGGNGEFPFVPKIADFGLAKLVESALEDSRSSVVVGTPWTDVYGLGTILYEVLSGRPPFTGNNVLALIDRLRDEEPPPVATLRPGLPRDLVTICHKCLAKEGNLRYASADELQNDLQRFLEGRPIDARPQGMLSKAIRASLGPHRVRDAGFYTVMVNLIMFLWTLVVAGLALTGSVQVPMKTAEILQGYLAGIFSALCFNVPAIIFGVYILKRRSWAALLGTLYGLISLSYTIPFVFGFLPLSYGGAYEDGNLRLLVFGLLSILFTVQTVLCGLAYRVLRTKQRSVPAV
jgi:tRNA A-37 threonylcarbamoyl transferase component Bud32